jgi:hypothetical protein
MQFRTQRLKDDFELEKKKRVRKEEDLKDAEDQITKLQQDLKKLEDLLERTSKRALAIRNKDDSPEMHASKKTKVEEVPANTMIIRNQKSEVKIEKADTSNAIRNKEPELKLNSRGHITSTESEGKVRKTRVIQDVPSKDEASSKSPPPGRRYLGLDERTQCRFHETGPL